MKVRTFLLKKHTLRLAILQHHVSLQHMEQAALLLTFGVNAASGLGAGGAELAEFKPK